MGPHIFHDIATELNLVITGGSDFHGIPKPRVNIGKFYGVDKLFPHIKGELIQRGYLHENV